MAVIDGVDYPDLVKVKSDHPDHVQGFYLLAKWHFDPAKHVLHEDAPPAPLPLPPLPGV